MIESARRAPSTLQVGNDTTHSLHTMGLSKSGGEMCGPRHKTLARLSSRADLFNMTCHCNILVIRATYILFSLLNLILGGHSADPSALWPR